MPDESVLPLIQPFASRRPSSITPDTAVPIQSTMEDPRLASAGGRKTGKQWVIWLSYVFDWIILIIAAGIGYVLGDVTPNKRHFSLIDPEIAYPYQTKETVPIWLAVVCAVFAPIVVIAIICLIFVPGSTVPRGTPRSLIWKRKLWELHTGWLGLALSIVASWLITNGMKNLFGKPRPDLLSRCQPDLTDIAKYVVGGIANTSSQLVSADICTNPDKYVLDDGFRSYPSGHSSSAAAGLIYLSLFVASKFAITIPYYAPGANASSFAAFPSRTRSNGNSKTAEESYELQNRGQANTSSSPVDLKHLSYNNHTVAAVRRQAAAPPLYLLLLAVLPFFGAVFIASSRWFDFRHHGFDILFGFFIGTVSAFFSFYYYHLPISNGAGWAWGPRSVDKAFWAGVGSASYATGREHGTYRSGDEEEGLAAVDSFNFGRSTGTGLTGGPPPSIRKTNTADEPVLQDTEYRSANTEYRGSATEPYRGQAM
ncbi:hypothetical protein OQA88_11726 [Cercophora sp. LCS_1]